MIGTEADERELAAVARARAADAARSAEQADADERRALAEQRQMSASDWDAWRSDRYRQLTETALEAIGRAGACRADRASALRDAAWRDDRAELAVLAAEMGDPLEFALEEGRYMRPGSASVIGYQRARALELAALPASGWKEASGDASFPNYDRMSGPLRSATILTGGWQHPEWPGVTVTVTYGHNERAGTWWGTVSITDDLGRETIHLPSARPSPCGAALTSGQRVSKLWSSDRTGESHAHQPAP